MAWLKGGHPERLGALAGLLAFVASVETHGWRIGDYFIGDALLDLAQTLFFAWLAFRCDRWWVLAMTGTMILIMLVHAAGLATPGLGWEANISARIGLGILSTLALLAGAGERAVSTIRRSPSRAT